jgi:ubiquinone/menaquinone biosynthesis C-methylase UbiE
MKPQQAYNSWAEQYDTNENKTRDLEGQALRNIIAPLSFTTCLEIGCGTGKNTEWLLKKAEHITAVDLSEAMLAKAQEKIASPHVKFIQADINSDWNFTNDTFDLITFSLVLEHIEHLDHIFKEVFKALNPAGYVYIGELHPFKQYAGSKARFETEEGTQIVQCYNHNVSDFVQAAKKYGLSLTELDEYFDNDDRTTIPRILTLLLQKTETINLAQ